MPETQGDYAISQHFLHGSQQTDALCLIFLHATTRDDKHWPEAHWRELIGLLASVTYQTPVGCTARRGTKRLAAGFDYVDVLPRMKAGWRRSGAGRLRLWPRIAGTQPSLRGAGPS